MSRTALSLFALTALAVVLPAFAQGLPDGKGKATTEDVCSQCHELSYLTNKGRTREEWEAIILEMRKNGAGMSRDQAAEILDYLATNLPPAPSR